MIFFLVLLGIIAPIVVVEPLQEQDSVVLPKLATTATLTGAAVVWGAVQLVRDRWPAGRWPVTLWVPLIAFLVVNVLAWSLAVDWRWSLWGERFRYQGLLTTLLYALLFAVTAASVRRPRDLRWLVFGLFIGGLGASVYALIQKAGLDWFDDFWARQVFERPSSTIGQTNAFGAYLVAVMSSSAFLVLTMRTPWQRAAIAVGVAVMGAALLVTVSQSAYLAAGVVILLAGLAATPWLWPALKARVPQPAVRAVLLGAFALPLAAAALVIAFIGLPGREAVVDAVESENIQGRLSLWRMGVEMAADRPLLGHGQDAFTILFAEYRDEPDLPGIGTSGIQPESSHNFFVDLASGTGVLGLLAFLALVGAVFWHATRSALSTDDDALRGALLAPVVGVVGYLAAIFFGFSEGMTTWLLWLLLGAITGLVARVEPGQGERARRSDTPEDAGLPVTYVERPRSVAAGMAAVVLFLLGVGALVWAATFVSAELASAQSSRASIRGDAVAAATLAERAADFNPFNKNYLTQHARAEENVGLETGDRAAALREGIRLQEQLLRRFRPAASDVIALGLARNQLARIEGEDLPPLDFACPAEIDIPIEDEIGLFECAIAMNPFDVLLRSFVAEHYEQEGDELAALFHRVVIFCWHNPCD